VPPQRSVILDAELGEHTSGEPVGIMLTSLSKLNDLLPDQVGYPIFRARGELELGAHSLKGPVHGLNVLGLVSESSGSGPYYHGAADGLELAAHRHSHGTARCRQMCDRHEELKTRAREPSDRTAFRQCFRPQKEAPLLHRRASAGRRRTIVAHFDLLGACPSNRRIFLAKEVRVRFCLAHEQDIPRLEDR